MRFRHKTTFFWIWLTALAMMLSALAPSISFASRAIQGADIDFASICTATGIKWVDNQSGEILESAPTTSKSAVHAERCEACLTHPLAILPVSQVLLYTPVIALTRMPSLFLQAPRTLFVWSQANPRAPPTA
jgi:Protein of unknown function (DUF2946)